MKKADIFLAISVALYSYLFYQQSLGINILIFSVLQVVFFYLSYKENTKAPIWRLSALGVLSSAIAIFLYGSTLGLVANMISLGALAFCSVAPGTSLIMGLFHNLYSVLGSSVFVVFEIVNNAEARKGKSSKRMKNILMFSIAFIVMLIFFTVYRSANSMFKSITDKIDLSFISGPWIGFTFVGFLLLYGLYKYQSIPSFEKFDLDSKNDLTPFDEPKGLDKLIPIGSEKTTGVILFVMLNVLLLFVNTTDIFFLFGGGEMPEGVSHSDIVHQGINALITSIVMAVGIILFFFRGRLNFIRQNRLLKNLSYLWIGQNMFIILSTAYRNHLYISDFLLTYKRIGVYVYLALSIIGLVYTLLKIKNTKTNWYIVRYVGWSFFVVLIVTPLLNWNRLIVNYNFSHAQDNIENVDFAYLVHLSPKTLPLVYNGMKSIDERLLKDYSNQIERKVKRYLSNQKRYDWRSFNLSDNKAVTEMTQLFPNIKIENMEPNNYYQSSDDVIY